MSLPVTRLRRWFLGAALLMSAVVAGFYFYARYQVAQHITKPLQKLGINIQQSADGFTISRSEAGRTLFTIKAKRLVQLKLSGHATLEDVQIIVYGKDSTRYDQITGKHFDYDKASGDVVAQGDVEIDLQGNAEGTLAPDQAMPQELKNPIHLRTNGLVFNQKSGDGYTKGRVEFTIPQAQGSAVGARYDSQARSLTLESHVAMQTTATGGNSPAQLFAARAVITDNPKRIALESAKMSSGSQTATTAAADLFLRDDNSVDNISGRGGVEITSAGPKSGSLHSQEARFTFGRGTSRGILQTADFRGNVQGKNLGDQPAEGSADHLLVNCKSFATSAGEQGKTAMGAESARAEGNVHLTQLPAGASRQRSELTAAAVDFTFSGGRHLQRAATAGGGQILLDEAPVGRNAAQHTVVTADQLVASFDPAGRISVLHGEPNSRITSSSPGAPSVGGQPDRISTSTSLDVSFKSRGGINALAQRGNLHYQDGEREAWGASGVYSLADQILTLTGDHATPPRITDKGLTTSADQIRVNRQSGEAWADGHVKSTYSDLKPQAGGALLASTEPIHLTAQSMHAVSASGSAEYRGAARLWQGANVAQGPVIRFERDARRMVADRSSSEPVTMVLLQKGRTNAGQLVTLTTDHLEYSDITRQAQLSGNVRALSGTGTLTSNQAEVLLKGKASGDASAGQIEQITLTGKVRAQQGSRLATGEKLTYQPDLGKYVLSGGIPSIFDAEHGKVAGNLLTFFDHDDRILVEGSATNPTVTHTESGR